MANEAIKNSFRAVKADILRLEGELMNIQARQVHIIAQLEKLAVQKSAPKAPAKKKAAKKKTAKKKVSKRK